ncbi:MAG: beta-hydroxyacyl-ACP dehydratase [Paludibacteraceae bacterium]|nr:beta-hydroxyacyl-ACP dehydratase [Paludibacteraceae bacterium]
MIDDFYTISNCQTDALNGEFEVELRPDCQVYKGHFPGKPVSPGVCSIQMIRECAEHVLDSRLHLRLIKQCRLTLLLSPALTPHLTVVVALLPDSGQDGQYTLDARIMHAGAVALLLKGTVEVCQ